MRNAITVADGILVCAAGGLFTAECGDSTSVVPIVTALTWNVYLGADIGRVLRARTADETVVLATR